MRLNPRNEENYQILLRALDWTEGFGLFFVECTPAQSKAITERTQQALSGQRVSVLELTAPLTEDLYSRIATFPYREELKVLFIQGLEKSLNEYIKPGIGGLGDYYKENTVPRVLGHLNLQRERFREDFPFCLVFLLPPYALKYFMLRGADFFDWRSGFFKFDTEEGVLKAETTRLLSEDFTEYLAMTPQQRREKWLALETCLEEAQPEEKAELLVQQGNLFYCDKEYLAALAHYDKVLALQPEQAKAWNNRVLVLSELGRGEEALASYDHALALQPEYPAAWINRGNVLSELGRGEEALASYDHALALQPEDPEDALVWNIRGNELRELGRGEEALASYDHALALQPEYVDAWYNRGIVLRELGRWEESLASYKYALLLQSSGNAGARLVVLIKLGRYREVLASLKSIGQYILGLFLLLFILWYFLF